MSDAPEYPVGCMIVSDSSYVSRRIGIVLAAGESSWEFRRILWWNGSVSLEGVVYLGAFYRAVSSPGPDLQRLSCAREEMDLIFRCCHRSINFRE